MTDPNRALRVGAKAPWPKGKPRNPPDPRWESLRLSVIALLATKGETGPYAHKCTARHIAKLCSVNAPNVSKWLNQSRNPPKAAVTIMGQWLRANK